MSLARCQMGSESCGPYLATCAGGLERIMLHEIAGKTYEANILATHAGGVVFTSSASPDDLKTLRSADNIYAFLLQRKVPVDKQPGLEYLQTAAHEVNWNQALAVFRRWNPGVRNAVWPAAPPLAAAPDGPPKFRVTCERRSSKLRKHEYTSTEAAGWLGFGIIDLLGWPVSMTQFDVEVIATIVDDELLLALSLLYSPRASFKAPKASPKSGQDGADVAHVGPLQAKAHHQSRQLYSHRPYRKDLVRTSLKPSTAYALCQLADIRPGHVVLDPLCGCGTIPLEVADVFGMLTSAVAAFGGELSEAAATKAGRNLAAGQQGGSPGPCDVIRWDATRLPWRDGTVDRVVSDMPFGVLCGTAKDRNNLWPSVLREVARVLVRGTGRAVLLCQGRKVRNDLERANIRDYFHTEETFPIVMEGIIVDVHILQRTQVEVVVRPSRVEAWDEYPNLLSSLSNTHAYTDFWPPCSLVQSAKLEMDPDSGNKRRQRKLTDYLE